MKIVVTGSLGNISKPLAAQLIKEGHIVTVVSSRPEMQSSIEAMGAIAAIGKLEDVDFLSSVFTGADAAYCMTPSNHSGDINYLAFNKDIAENYVQAIRASGVNNVIHLSSYGAHLPSGTGLIVGKYHAEIIFNQLKGVSVTHMRAVYFYNNLYSFINMIKGIGGIRANYGGDHRFALVSPKDIATAVATAIVNQQEGHTVQYVASDERTGDEVAAVLGAAIGIPDLKWTVISDEEMRQGLEANGMAPHVAVQMTEMLSCVQNGILEENYAFNKPVLGKVKLEDFAAEFGARFGA